MISARLCGRLMVAGLVAVLVAGSPAVRAQDTGEGDTTDLQVAGQVNWTLGDKAMAYVTTSSTYDTLRIGSASVMPADSEDPATAGKKMLDIGGWEGIDGPGSIYIGLDYTEDPAKDGTVITVQYYAEMAQLPYWSSGAEGKAPVTVTFDSFSFDGAKGHAKGSFAGELCKVTSWEAAPDPADCVPVAGTFDTEVYGGL